jgi:hypothetical protein
MAGAPLSITLLWQRLKEEGVAIPPEVWEAWDGCLALLEDIKCLASVKDGEDLPVGRAGAVTQKSVLVQRFIRSIRPSSDGNSRVVEGVMYLHPLALELVVHYIGNDLYVIALIADVPANDPLPVPFEEAREIVRRAGLIRDFLDRLKGGTAR